MLTNPKSPQKRAKIVSKVQLGALEPIPYTIHKYSSQSAQYSPQNILENNPTDQASRWSTATNDQNQFLTLKLVNLSVVRNIKFGKFHKAHVCNLKEFKVFGCLEAEEDGSAQWIELLHAGLKNDTEAETFSVKFKSGDNVFPCRYIKIVPILPWGPNFNFSIWHVALSGHVNPSIVTNVYNEWISHREGAALKLVLKHLRRYPKLLPAFEVLQNLSQVELEDATLTKMHHALVIEGDWDTVEEIIKTSAKQGLFDEYCRDLSNGKFQVHWELLSDEDGNSPCPRGGHQLLTVPDETGNMILLFGGWSGTDNLDDLWIWKKNAWRQIHPRGPSPCARSCHKLCWDSTRNHVYLLGRFVESEDGEGNVSMDEHSDFWRLDVLKMQWHLVSEDTRSDGGPGLLYDHQMTYDPDTDSIYVFGGKNQVDYTHSGLYKYSIGNDSWSLISENVVKSRIGHSMVMDGSKLLILGGLRSNEGSDVYLSDIQSYDVLTGEYEEICRDFTRNGGPEEGFTHRATLEPSSREIILYSGTLKKSSTGNIRNILWIYQLDKKRWYKAYENKHSVDEPCARFAHQWTWDPETSAHYLFGGNPGLATDGGSSRLGDFWKMTVSRPTAEDVLRKSQFLIRKQVYREMCGNDDIQALTYLKQYVNSCVNHNDSQEETEFREMAGWLFDAKSHDGYAHRTRLYEALVEYFPNKMKQPQESLLDLLPW